MSRRGWVALLLSVWLPVACAAQPPTHARPDDHCIRDFRSGTDYFPDKTTVLDAANFTLSYHDYYQVLTVKQPYPHGRPESYVLVRCGAPAPPDTGELAGAQRITVPVTSLYSGSTTQLGMIAELGRTDVVTGVADAANVVNPQLRQRNSYAVGGRIDTERVVAAHPDVLISAGVDESAYPTLRQAGVPVLADAEWLEKTPLGRAEWIKVLAALTGTEKQAGQLYRRLRDDYAAVARASAGTRPTEVLPGTMYQGTWSMPTGGDYAGRLISDAGGSYPWADATATGSLSLTFESVYALAGRAPVWLVFDSWKSIADAVADDSRYTELSAVRDGQVWTAGGSDYWERGPARPDLVLSDLAAILHPDLAPHHRFTFYHRVPRP